MPIILSIDELQPGMRLMYSVYRDHQVLLPAGKILEEWEINTLRRRYPNLTLRIADPILDEFVEFQDNSHDETVAVTVNRQMSKLMLNVRDKLDKQTCLHVHDITGLQNAINAMMKYITENPVTAAMMVQSRNWDTYVQDHSANVFYLSILIGNAIRNYVFRERERATIAKNLSVRYGMNLTPLALGCFFHDIGMIAINHVYQHSGPLSAEDRELILQHPIKGAEMLPKDFDAVAKMVVRTHHENCDGSGYPNAIDSKKLHIFSRIIRVTDAFDAATSDKIYKQARSAARTLWEITAGPHRTHYDKNVVKILLGLVMPFPIGAKIRVDNGMYGVVVRHNRKHPFRPTIIIAFDDEGKKLKRQNLSKPIDLAKNDNVRLIGFGKESLDFLYDTSTDAELEYQQPNREELEASLMDFCYP